MVFDYEYRFSYKHQQSKIYFDHALYIAIYFTSAKTLFPSSPDVLVNTSVFCIDLRLEVGGKTIEGLSVFRNFIQSMTGDQPECASQCVCMCVCNPQTHAKVLQDQVRQSNS